MRGQLEYSCLLLTEAEDEAQRAFVILGCTCISRVIQLVRDGKQYWHPGLPVPNPVCILPLCLEHLDIAYENILSISFGLSSLADLVENELGRKKVQENG